MNDRKRKRLRMDAAMDRERANVANIGEQVSLSEMELICLVNFAEVGVMSVFSADGSDGAEMSLNAHLDRIRKEFADDGRNGLLRLATTAAAMLRGERLSKYIV